MKLLKLFKNQAGVTLLESMVAISILSVISLTVATLLKNAGEGVKTNEAKSEITGLKNILLSNFTDTAACTNTFGAYITQANLSAATGSGLVTIAFIKDKLNNPTYSTASTNIRPLTITGMYFTNYSTAGGTADLLVKTTFQKSSTQVINLKDIRVPINMSIGGTAALPTLSSCSTMAIGDDWMLAGNAGTVDGTDYIGTSDDVPLNFRVNARPSGRINSIGVTTFGYEVALNAGTTSGYSPDITAFGFKAARSSGGPGTNENSAFGYRALELASGTGNRNTAVGWNSLSKVTTARDNTAVGASALKSNLGQENTGVGHGALSGNTTGYQNTAVGALVMPYTTSGNNNTAFGYYIMYGNSGYAGSGNTAVGTGILYNSSGSWNSVLGAGALSKNSIGSYNTAVGGNALALNTTGTNNTALGERSGDSNVSGYANTTLGSNSGSFNSAGNYNTFVGTNSGQYVQGSWNTFLGASSSAVGINNGSYNLFLGPAAGQTAGTYSYKLEVETNNVYAASPLIEGDFSAAGRYVTIDGRVGIGTQDLTSAKLTVNGIPSTSIPTTFRVVNDSHIPYTIGVQSVVDHAGFGNWSTAIVGNNYSLTNPGSYTVGVRGNASQATYNGQSRMYGSWFTAGNGNTGHNYAIIAQLAGDTAAGSRGAAIWAAANNEWPQNMDDYNPLNTRWAGVFVGPVYVSGPIYAAAHLPISDKRLKKNITPLKNSLEKITKLRGVEFDWKDDKYEMGTQLGFIAQEVQEVFPQLVSAKKESQGMKAVNYSAMVAPVIEAIKELYAKILALVSSDEQQNIEIKSLKAENEKLKTQMKLQQESLEVRMKKLEAKSAKQK